MDWLGVLKRIERGEDEHTELGRFRSFAEKDWQDTVCAFANTEGGLVVLGIAKDGSFDGVPMDAEEPRSRNEAIANFLFDLGLMEQRGSGYLRIIRAMKARERARRALGAGHAPPNAGRAEVHRRASPQGPRAEADPALEARSRAGSARAAGNDRTRRRRPVCQVVSTLSLPPTPATAARARDPLAGPGRVMTAVNVHEAKTQLGDPGEPSLPIRRQDGAVVRLVGDEDHGEISV